MHWDSTRLLATIISGVQIDDQEPQVAAWPFAGADRRPRSGFVEKSQVGGCHRSAVAQLLSLGGMKSIASIEVDFAAGLLERLKQESIPAEVRAVTQDSGLEYSDIMVADDYYDRACDVAEAWEAERFAEAEKKSNRHCPRCGSPHLEYVSADTFGIGSIWKCKDCGNDFAK